MTENNRARLAEIAAKNKTSKDDKQFVLDMCEQMGVPFEGNVKCSSCYRDMAAKLWSLGKSEERSAEKGRKVMVIAGTYIWMGKVICNATIKTDEDCEKLIAAGCPKRLFVYADK